MERVLFLFLVLVLLLIPASGCISCDGMSYNFYLLYEEKGQSLTQSLDSMIKENTHVLRNCFLVRYAAGDGQYLGQMLSKYSIRVYNASFSCDILNFDTDIYERDGRLYSLFRGMGPCGQDNVNFLNASNEYVSLESGIIRQNSKNFDFCMKREKRDHPDSEFGGESCILIQVESLKDNVNQSLNLCDKIKWVPTRTSCYRIVVENVLLVRHFGTPKADVLQRANQTATDICNRLDQTIPDNDPYKNTVGFCFESVDRA